MTDEKNSAGAAALRQKLVGLQGQRYWRTLEEWAGTEDAREWIENEFPYASSLLAAPVSRRDFLRLM